MKKFKIITITSLMLASFAISASAISAVQDITAQIRPDYIVEIDKVEQSFENANGDIVYPILYQGTTYIPLRAVGEIMNKNVFFNGDTKTIGLLEKDVPLSEFTEQSNNSILLPKVDDKDAKGVICSEFTATTGNVSFTITEPQDIGTFNVKLFTEGGGMVCVSETISIGNGVSFSELEIGKKYYFEVSSFGADEKGTTALYKISQY